VILDNLLAGWHGHPHRSTDATVYSVVEGHGKTQVGDKVFEWGPKDTLVVPSGHYHQHFASDECVLFSYSVQQALGLWREDRDNFTLNTPTSTDVTATFSPASMVSRPALVSISTFQVTPEY
jgi:hypothetical protein